MFNNVALHSFIYNMFMSQVSLYRNTLIPLQIGEVMGWSIIDNKPTKSLGLILALMHQIKLKINIDF